MIWVHTFRWLGKMFLIKFQSMNIPIVETKGLSLRVPDTVDFIIGLDHDRIVDKRLIEELKCLQHAFGLGDFHVFGTAKYSRHSICIDRMPLRNALDIIYASTCDAVFKRGIMINEWKTWILRTHPKGDRPKPEYLYTVESPRNGERLQSQGHAIFLQAWYGIKVRLVNPDGNTSIEMQNYKTSTKVDLKYVKKKKTEEKT